MKISLEQLNQSQNFKLSKQNLSQLFKSSNGILWLTLLVIAIGVSSVGLNMKSSSTPKKQLNVSELKVGDQGIVRGTIVSKKTLADNPNQKMLSIQTDSGVQVSVSGSPWQLDKLGNVGEFVEISADVSSPEFLSNPRLIKEGQSNKSDSSLQSIQIWYEEEAEFYKRGQYLIHIQSHGELIPLYLNGKLKSRLTLGEKYEVYFSKDEVQCIKELNSESKVCN